MDYNLKVKINGEWKTFGKVKENKWGKLQASFKNSAELKDVFHNGGEWVNFAMFEAKPKVTEETQAILDEMQSKNVLSSIEPANILSDEDNSIPF